jgi:mono/diheme cytochrome c family protein
MNKAFLKILAFVVLVVAGFVFIANSIPQVEPQKPKTDEDLKKLDQASFIKAGEEIFNGKGTCYVCHSIGPRATARCPDLAGIGARAEDRAREAGNPDGLSYLVEALHDPNTYVVKDYPAIMPKAYKPPISLTPMEMKAVISFLQSLGGEVTVTPESELPTQKWATDIQAALASAGTIPTGRPLRGKDIFFNKMRCVACHRVNNVGGVQGPDLSDVGAINTAEYLRESVAEPGKVLVKGYKDIMPPHFDKHLSDKEMDDLVAFLQTLRGAAPSDTTEPTAGHGREQNPMEPGH